MDQLTGPWIVDSGRTLPASWQWAVATEKGEGVLGSSSTLRHRLPAIVPWAIIAAPGGDPSLSSFPGGGTLRSPGNQDCTPPVRSPPPKAGGLSRTLAEQGGPLADRGRQAWPGLSW